MTFFGRRLSRRQLLAGAGTLAAGGAASLSTGSSGAAPAAGHDTGNAGGHGGNMVVGEVDLSRFDPSVYLTRFDYGTTSRGADGRVLREWKLVASDQDIEVAPGVVFPAWTYNGQVPGPTLRCTEGDRLRIHFVNAGTHPHTIHFHGIHAAAMDGVFEVVDPGGEFTYEFDAEPFGLHLYHCHVPPLRRHIHKGLYGVFIVDPPEGRPPARELVMTMNGFDTNLDGENEVYAVNTVAFHYVRHPIALRVGELVRIYLVNITEFDPVNSLHTHANFFSEYRTGTSLSPNNLTDVCVLAQAERAVLELTYRFPGTYMFHAHQTEFSELGWTGMFEVAE
ncbi:MAG: multicopper oxidase domain-containing protein [Acidimicrobiia bacterium]